MSTPAETLSTEKASKRRRGGEKPQEINHSQLGAYGQEIAFLKKRLDQLTTENTSLSTTLDKVTRERDMAVARWNKSEVSYKEAKTKVDMMKSQIKMVNVELLHKTVEWQEQMKDLCPVSKITSILANTLKTKQERQIFPSICDELIATDYAQNIGNYPGEVETMITELSSELHNMKPRLVQEIKRLLLELVRNYAIAMPQFAKCFTLKMKNDHVDVWYAMRTSLSSETSTTISNVMLDFVARDMKNYSTTFDKSQGERLHMSLANSILNIIDNERKLRGKQLDENIIDILKSLWN